MLYYLIISLFLCTDITTYMRRGCCVKQYKRPGFCFIHNSGELSGDEIARLSDDELADYLSSDNMKEEKKRYRIKPGFILREIAGEYAIIPVDTDGIFSNTVMAPNDTAVFLWKVFEQSGTIEDAVIKGMQEYDVTEEVIRTAAEQFVKESLQYEVLEEVK